MNSHFIILFCILILHSGEPLQDGNNFFLSAYANICDGQETNRISPTSCGKDLIIGTRPENDCICLQGIWISLDGKCEPKLHFGSHGCMEANEIRALRLAGTFGKSNDFVVIATLPQSTRNQDWPKIKLLRPIQKVNVAGTIWVLNGRIVRQKSVYCVEHYPFPKVDMIREYQLIGFIKVKSQCLSPVGTPIASVRNFHVNDSIPAHLRCEQDCLKNPVFRNLSLPPTTTESPPTMIKQPVKMNISNYRSISRSLTKKRAHIDLFSKDLRDEHELLNRIMLKTAVSIAMSPVNSEINDTRLDVPPRSFTILSNLIDVTSKACGEKISKNFLKRAYNFYKAAYDIRGGDLNEVFGLNETDLIISVLKNCSDSFLTMNFRMKPVLCNEQIYSYEVSKTHFVPIQATKGHPDFKKHTVLETIWNMIDLTTAACINPFKVSYLIYHRWEQGMEKIFTDSLRVFWQYPLVTYAFYSRILGPDWKIQSANLEKCVEAAYIKQYKMSRLLRPLWTRGSRKRKYKFAYWRNKTMYYSLDGIHEESQLAVNFPMGSETLTTSSSHQNLHKPRGRGIQSFEKIHSFDCNRNYYCQSND